MSRAKEGLLLLNLGTPASTQISDVRKYLAEFLMDPFVVDLPAVLRFALVYGLILRSRPARAAEAYRKIWTERGSPLAFHLEDLATKVRSRLSESTVYTAMRYGTPSIRSAVKRACEDGISRLTIFPLYPQYSLSATESSIDKVNKVAKEVGFNGELRFVPEFHADPGFVRSFAEIGKKTSSEMRADFILFSFHGLPERHVKRASRDYQVQSFETAHAIAHEMGMNRDDFEKRYSVSFQSRLGVRPWIRPYTDVVIPKLARQGVKRIAVISPSFVADCLETLEEIGIRARESFVASGGEDLRLVPSLNSADLWVNAVCELRKTAK